MKGDGVGKECSAHDGKENAVQGDRDYLEETSPIRKDNIKICSEK